MADFVISTELNASEIEKGKKVAVSAADQLQRRYENFLKILGQVEIRIRNIFGLLQSLNRIKMPSFSNVDEKSQKILKDLIKLRNTELKLIQQKNKSELDSARSSQKLAETDARHKARMAEIAARGRIQAENAANRAIEAQRRREFSEFQRLEREKTRVASAEARNRSNFASRVGSAGQNFGQSLSSAGVGLTAAVSVPVAAAVYKVGEYSLEMDAFRNQLTAFEGSAEKAEQRLLRLRQVSDQFVGATREMTYETYNLLKPLNTLSDDTIEKTIGSLGKLKLGFKNMIPADFVYNLTQIFSQGFEESDIKQAIGQVPKFREYLLKAFGTDDNQALKTMKESGKLTMDSFFQGFAEAVQNDAVLSGLKEPVRLRIQKLIERGFEAVEPLADRLVTILGGAIDYISPKIAAFAAWFKDLAPAFQYVILGISGFVAALGPVLVVLGSVVGFIATVVSGLAALGAGAGILAGLAIAAKFVGVALLVLIGLFIQLLPVILAVLTAAFALYTAWKTNFGGIRDYTVQAFTFVKSVVETSMTFIKDKTETIGAGVMAWWEKNYPLIEAVVVKVSNAVKLTIGLLLTVIQNFWKAHGEEIVRIALAIWTRIEDTVTTLLNLIGNVIRFGLQIINKDWDGAWKTFLEILENASSLVSSLIRSLLESTGFILRELLDLVLNIGASIVQGMDQWSYQASDNVVKNLSDMPARIVELVPRLYKAGMSVVQAIWEGIKAGWNYSSASGGLDALSGVGYGEIVFGESATLGNIAKTQDAAAKISDSAKKAKSKTAKAPNPKAEFNKENRVISGNAQWDKWVYEAAKQYNIDPLLIFAQMNQESTFKKNAVSNKGASGLMQLMPATARDLGVKNIFDPKQNIFAGVKYLRQQLNTFDGNVALALAAYNAGPGAVQKYGNQIPPYKETQDYVKRISNKYQQLKGGKFQAGSNFDLSKSLEEQSDKLTRDAEESVLRQTIALARQSGIRPDDETISRYQRLLADEARQTGNLQPSIESVSKQFQNYQDYSKLTVSEPIQFRELEDSQAKYILGLEEAYKISERSQALNDRQLYFQEELNAKVYDYNLALKEQMQDLIVEQEFLKTRDKYAEANVEYQRQYNIQFGDIADIERDLLVLKAQNLDDQFTEQRRLLALKREEFSLQKEITDLQDELANQGVNDNLKIQTAFLRDVVDLRNRELNAVISINRSQLELSQKMEISNNQIRAQVLDHFAQQKSLNEAIADGIIKIYDTVADKIDKTLDKIGIGKIPILGDIAKSVSRNFLSKITTDLMDSIFPGLSEITQTQTDNPIAKPIVTEQQKTNKILDKIAGKLGVVGTGADSFFSSIINSSGGSNGNSGSGGGIFSTIFSGIGKLLGLGGGSKTAATPPFVGNNFSSTNPNGLSNQIQGLSSVVGVLETTISKERISPDSTLIGQTRSASGQPVNDVTNKVTSSVFSGGKFSLSGLGKSLGSMAPMLGLSLGTSLGGQSVIGQILGAGGGLLGGLAAGIGTGALGASGGLLGGLVGALGGTLAATGVLAAVAAPLLIGAWLLGRNKKRRQEEIQRTAIINDSFAQLDDLIKQVTTDRADGQSAIASANTIRSQYLQQVSQLTDKKTRTIAQKDVYRLDAKIDLLRQAVDAQDKRRSTAKELTAEFSTGGVYRAFADGGTAHPKFADAMKYSGMLPKSFSGTIPGSFDKKDDILLAVSRGERVIVMTPNQWNAVGDRMNPLLKEARVPGFNTGVVMAPQPSKSISSSDSESSQINITFENVTFYQDAEKVVFDGLKSDKNQKVVVKAVKNIILK